ncbi:MAG TPA: hypothetical protein VKB75_12610 [Jatrophihabitans sp.]|nr:hypothetical protein [Jatrophihabitans sp.]
MPATKTTQWRTAGLVGCAAGEKLRRMGRVRHLPFHRAPRTVTQSQDRHDAERPKGPGAVIFINEGDMRRRGLSATSSVTERSTTTCHWAARPDTPELHLLREIANLGTQSRSVGARFVVDVTSARTAHLEGKH